MKSQIFFLEFYIRIPIYALKRVFFQGKYRKINFFKYLRDNLDGFDIDHMESQ